MIMPRVGMKGTIKLHLKRTHVDPTGYTMDVAEDMREFCSQTFTITAMDRSSIRNNPYIFHIDLDNEGFFWNTDMVTLHPPILLKPRNI